MGMTVGDLKEYLENFDDRAKIYYFDSEAGEDVPLKSSWLSVTDDYGELEIVEDGMTNKEYIDKLIENIPAWKLVLIDKWTDFKVWFWLKTHKGVETWK